MKLSGASHGVDRPPGTSGNAATPVPKIPDHELLRCVGRGAYGEVWLARNVMGSYRAVKVVWQRSFETDRPYEREFAGIQKFEPVSRAHEGLVDILHVGRNDEAGYFFYVMELADDLATATQINPDQYEPKTLQREIQRRGRLPVDECLRISLSLTNGLGFLHEEGLVHRDVKPSNIIFVKGTPKLADIGLVCETDSTRSQVGTEGYIPPEGPGTPQADLYSLGKVLYEMSTGKSREHFPDLPTDLREHAESSALLELNEVLLKACAADARRRYQAAREMETELALLEIGKSVRRKRKARRRWATAAIITAALLITILTFFLLPHLSQRNALTGAQFKSIVVLPFANLSSDRENDYLSEGLTEEIINALTKISPLRVARGRDANLRAVTERLNPSTLLEGSVRPFGDQIHISARLRRPADNSYTWSDECTYKIGDLLHIQSDFAQRVAGALKVQLGIDDKQRLARKPTDNPEAYKLYLKGRFFWNHRAEGKLQTALQFFKQAIEVDPAFALAYSGLADCYSSQVFTYDAGSVSPTNGMPRAQAAANQAMKLEPELAECLTSQAFVDLIYNWKWAEAGRGFTNALALNPNYAHVHHWYSHYLMAVGQTNGSLAESQKALELEPGDFIINIHLGWHYLFTRDGQLALKQFQQTSDMYPENPLSHRYLGLAYAQLKNYRLAISEFEKAVELSSTNSIMLGGLGHTLAIAGDKLRARQVLEQLRTISKERFVSPYYLALIHAGLGENQEAFRSLDEAFAQRCDALIYLNQDPWLDNLRGHSQFATLLQAVGLPRPVAR